MTSTIEPFVKAILSVPQVAGRFSNLITLSANGFFSIVFEATDESSERRVVLKFLRPDRQDEYRTKCFHREAEIALELRKHPNIISALTAVDHHLVPVQLPDGTSLPFPFKYFATEMGTRDFAAYLFGPRRKRPALWRRLQIVRDITKGVGRLHRSGFSHRDLKPDNVFLFPGGAAKLGDLGTCRRLVDKPLKDDYGGPVGSRRYAAPELFTPGVAEDPQLMPLSDWFAVGAITFEAVSGINLYSAIGLTSVPEIIASFARFGSRAAYLRVVGDVAGQYPIPLIDDYLPKELAERHSERTILAVDRLIRRLCHFDFERRLAEPDRIIQLIDIAIASARIDEEGWSQRLQRTRRHTVDSERTTLILSGS
jgi:serine/threonine protein kinase